VGSVSRRLTGGVTTSGANAKEKKLMAKKKSTKAHLAVASMPKGRQWAHKKTGKAKTKNLAKLCTK
jgi:hypothetical protein